MGRGKSVQSDEQILRALAIGSSQEQAAKTAGVSSKTVQRRLKDPDFKRRLSEILNENTWRTSAMMTAIALEAPKALLNLLQSSTPPSVRCRAVNTALVQSRHLRAEVELMERIEYLEKRLEEYREADRPDPEAN